VIRPPYRQSDYRIENYPGGFATSVASASDAHILVGFYRDGKGDTEGFVNVHGTWTGVKSNSNLLELLDINDAGKIVGFYADRYGVDHAFEGPFRRIKPPGGISDVAAGINDSGHVVGYMTLVSSAVEGFLFAGGAYTDLLYPGATNTAAFGINGRDEIVGSYSDSSGATHGFLLTSPRKSPHWQSFDEPKACGFTRVSGINDGGEFVGSYRDASGVMHGFLCR
jgi:probable HAF family extracellular repeat protein